MSSEWSSRAQLSQETRERAAIGTAELGGKDAKEEVSPRGGTGQQHHKSTARQ